MSSSKDYTGQSFIQPTRHDTYPFIDPTKLDLSDRRVFISGASRGIGRALAVSFAKAGASYIAIGARSDLSATKKEIENAAKAAGRALPEIIDVNLDVTSWSSMQDAAKKIESEFGSLDVLVNNAGILSRFDKIVDADVDEWWQNFEVNVKGVFLAKKAFIPLLLKSNLKTFVNVSSIGAQIVGDGAAYQTAKHSINRLTEATVAQYKEQGLTGFAIHPGAVATGLAYNMPKYIHNVLIDTPELPADTIVFLTSQRRVWLSGRYISSNWDMENFLKEEHRVVKEDLLKNKLQV